ncbi:hypothetical protein GF323_00705 [Candidatus Woesearchaeota archaeon]|nr:hypothetical protein [Candidatus Woesearchaeota archaeon]
MKGKIDFFAIMLLMMVFFIGLISYIFNLSGWKFYLELVIWLGLLFFSIIALTLIYTRINMGYMIASIVSAVVLLNLVLLYFRAAMNTLLFLGIISSTSAFVISVVNIGGMAKKREKVVLKTYTPGKVVSSKRAKYYHAPKCDWAKRIKKSNQQWYDSADQAKKDGLEPHGCLE